jgi:hypothetical protein
MVEKNLRKYITLFYVLFAQSKKISKYHKQINKMYRDRGENSRNRMKKKKKITHNGFCSIRI